MAPFFPVWPETSPPLKRSGGRLSAVVVIEDIALKIA
jgi:hypothetical protein